MPIGDDGFYTIKPLITRSPDVGCIVGARGTGKTFAVRKEWVNDYLKRKLRFLSMTRHKNELARYTHDYFGQLQARGFYTDYNFRYEVDKAFIEKKQHKGKKPQTKSKYEIIGYFGALTEAQSMKKRTFVRCRNFDLDEFLIDFEIDKFHNYLPNEIAIVANIIDSASRERADEKSLRKPRLICMANAVDLINPWFAHYGIKEPPKEGFSWHGGKTMLLEYFKDSEYSQEKSIGTVAGRMLAGSKSGNANILNEFFVASNGLIAAKTKVAKFDFGWIYKGRKLGAWLDYNAGYYYICEKIPDNTNRPVFNVLGEDGNLNYIAADRANRTLKGFSELYYKGCIRYETEELRLLFIESLKMFGIR